MRRATWLLVGALTGCFSGGQTGEITTLTACAEPVGEVSLDEASAAGRPAREQVRGLTPSARDAAASVDVAFALADGPGVLLGGPECERPLLRASVRVTLASDDGSLAETLDGTIVVDDSGHGSVQAITEGPLAGSLELEGGTLTVDLLVGAAALEGHVTIHDAGTERVLATF